MHNEDLLRTIDEDASHEVDVMSLKFETKLQKENEAGVALMVREKTDSVLIMRDRHHRRHRHHHLEELA